MQPLAYDFTMQFIKIITVRGVKVEILKDCRDILLLNNNTWYFDYIFLVVFDNYVNNFVNLCNLFGGFLLGEKAVYHTLVDDCYSFLSQFLPDFSILKVAE